MTLGGSWASATRLYLEGPRNMILLWNQAPKDLAYCGFWDLIP